MCCTGQSGTNVKARKVVGQCDNINCPWLAKASYVKSITSGKASWAWWKDVKGWLGSLMFGGPLEPDEKIILKALQCVVIRFLLTLMLAMLYNCPWSSPVSSCRWTFWCCTMLFTSIGYSCFWRTYSESDAADGCPWDMAPDDFLLSPKPAHVHARSQTHSNSWNA